MVSTIDADTVEGRVGRALESAHARTSEVASKKVFHQLRSSNFVADLAEEFGSHYTDDPDVRVFSKDNASNKKDFGLNELLYDVTVCRTATVMSATGRKSLRYVAAPLWHIESELKEDSQQALYDFNKLVLGAAPFNLFVGPLVHHPGSFVDVLRAPAARCLGKVFVARIPHPREWDSTRPDILCEELK